MDKQKVADIDYALQKGERCIENAPFVRLSSGHTCIPQHYLSYAHDLQSVEAIVAEIEYDERYLVFACLDNEQVYLQVGVVGLDNYKPAQDQRHQKLVYGRKWRVEPALPSSEIIQTVFLALKKAREHEVRELFRFKYQGTVTTPFNNHHDLPLICQRADYFTNVERELNTDNAFQLLQANLDAISYDSAGIQLTKLELRESGQWLLDLQTVGTDKSQLPEVESAKLTLVLPSLSSNELYFQLMQAFIDLSDRHVDEHFKYKHFSRFSRHNSVIAIAKLSLRLRKNLMETNASGFKQNFEKLNIATDESRVPQLSPGPLAKKIQAALSSFGALEGALPLP